MKKTFNVIIIDDDELARESLAFELKSYPAFQIVGTAKSGINGKRLLFNSMPDLIFIDVELPDMTGLDFLHQIENAITWNMKVIFYSAYDKYVKQAFRKELTFDFLSKPIDKKELSDIMKRFLEKETQQQPRAVPPEIQIKSIGTLQDMMILTSATNDLSFIRPENIGFFQYNSTRKLWEVFLNYSTVPVLLKKGTTAETLIGSSECFVQIHQSHILNIHYLMMIRDKKCVLYPPFDHFTELQVSKLYMKKIQKRFFLF